MDEPRTKVDEILEAENLNIEGDLEDLEPEFEENELREDAKPLNTDQEQDEADKNIELNLNDENVNETKKS